MLWYFGKQPVADAVQQAAVHYQAKYDRAATDCYVHPEALTPDGAPKSVGAIRVQARRNVLRGHLWLGVEQAK